jgi:hypothetical protein
MLWNLIITRSLWTLCYENPVILYSDAVRTVLNFSTILSPSALPQPNSDLPPCSLVHRQQRAVTILVTPHILDSRRYISWFASLIITNFVVRSRCLRRQFDIESLRRTCHNNQITPFCVFVVQFYRSTLPLATRYESLPVKSPSAG